MGTTPLTYACAVCFINFCAETKFKKGASDRNSSSLCESKIEMNGTASLIGESDVDVELLV